MFLTLIRDGPSSLASQPVPVTRHPITGGIPRGLHGYLSQTATAAATAGPPVMTWVLVRAPVAHRSSVSLRRQAVTARR